MYEANYTNSLGTGKPKGVTTQFDKKTISVEKFGSSGQHSQGAAALTINMNSLFDDEGALKLVYAVGAENGVLLFEIGMDNSVRFLSKLSGQPSP